MMQIVETNIIGVRKCIYRVLGGLVSCVIAYRLERHNGSKAHTLSYCELGGREGKSDRDAV